jgi:hypothetical protein
MTAAFVPAAAVFRALSVVTTVGVRFPPPVTVPLCVAQPTREFVSGQIPLPDDPPVAATPPVALLPPVGAAPPVGATPPVALLPAVARAPPVGARHRQSRSHCTLPALGVPQKTKEPSNQTSEGFGTCASGIEPTTGCSWESRRRHRYWRWYTSRLLKQSSGKNCGLKHWRRHRCFDTRGSAHWRGCCRSWK